MTIWILTATGFYSIVEKPWDTAKGTLTVRARVRADLERLKAYLPDMSDIIESDDSDYRFRTVADRRAVSVAMTKLVAEIDYDNFKNEVAKQRGYDRAEVYSHVWGELYRLQNGRFEEPPAEERLI